MDFSEILKNIREKILCLRGIERYLELDISEFWDELQNTEKERILHLIKEENIHEIRKIIRLSNKGDLNRMKINRLKLIANKEGIKKAYKMCRSELIFELKRKKEIEDQRKQLKESFT